MKKISILGSTGSIGTQSLTVVDTFPDELTVTALSCYSDIDTLEKQIKKYKPEIACVLLEDKANELRERIISTNTEIISGEEGLITAATASGTEMLLTAVSGMVGLKPTLAAINAGINIALANKETLVAGGNFVMDAAAQKGVQLIPVDSEHSAIFQCLFGNDKKALKRIILTASGGPFRGKTRDAMKNVTVKEALKHPNWSMGKKITIDSATMMNKGLEVIEARWLFATEAIDVVVHPQSIVHSMVEYADHSVIAQMGLPDMTLPIQIAFFHPERRANNKPSLDLTALSKLTFEAPDSKTFGCLALAYEALKMGGTASAILNGANEVSVARFLKGEIRFLDIETINASVLEKCTPLTADNLECILEADSWARREAEAVKF